MQLLRDPVQRLFCINLHLSTANPCGYLPAPCMNGCCIQLIQGLQGKAILPEHVNGYLLQTSVPKPPFEIFFRQGCGQIHAASVARCRQQSCQHLFLKHQIPMEHQQVIPCNSGFRQEHGVNIVGVGVPGIFHQGNLHAVAFRLLPDQSGVCTGGDDRLPDAMPGQQPQLPGQNGFAAGQGE